ncbi:hypothetical protein GQ43DRAFT_445481 [Delitschia confertaspora ATCC 74209]|uniref:Polyprenal reductase n=1 Tax=Delitschia confertaspora ATCC 74209 TaxID=1513339 RepID=A0A9P4MQJ1_9PLEO|nr:hypothetical protein GQ43DRAFT_445481 [Delitschia confertaspora ATCC 74209]
MMALQGVRRLMESDLYTPKNSGSQMWIGHYALGLLFYFTINMAIWIEAGVPVLNRAVPFIDWTKHMTPDPMVQKFPSNGETLKVVILPPAILTFHFLQHSYHSYLHSLRTEHSTYQLPSHPYFPHLLCPHYSCEVMIYLLLSLLAAPAGGWVNWTLFTATVFVAVNLGVTANGTRAWYIKNFGKERVGGRKRMVPGVW